MSLVPKGFLVGGRVSTRLRRSFNSIAVPSIFSGFSPLGFGVSHVKQLSSCLSALAVKVFSNSRGYAMSPIHRNYCPQLSPQRENPLPGTAILNSPHPPRTNPLTNMSRTHAAATSSSNQTSNFQVIFNDALNYYERRTNENLLAHPLAAELQDCDSPSGIHSVLQQVQELNQSQSSHDHLTKWLGSTVNVLCTFSATLGEGVGLVRLRPSICEMCAHIAFDRLYHQRK
jgi:hypothetical protein